jgi:hypothetical protein
MQFNFKKKYNILFRIQTNSLQQYPLENPEGSITPVKIKAVQMPRRDITFYQFAD